MYLLHGEEAYYLDLICSNLEKYAVADDDKDFNCDILYGNDTDVAYVVATAQQFPVMADRKLVILKEAQTLFNARQQLEKLAAYASHPNVTTVLAVVYKGEPFKASSALVKGVKEGGGIIFQSDVPADYQLASHIRDYITEHRINIDDKALELMIEFIGAPLSKFFGELDKLSMIRGAGNRITCEDVEKNIGISKDFNNYELVNALSSRNYPKAMRIVKYFENNPRTSQKTNPLMTITSVLFNYFSNLVTAHYMADKSDQALSAQFGFRARVQLSTLKDGMRQYPPAKAVNAIHHLREYDTKSKGIESNQSACALLDDLIFKIFT